MKYVVDCQVDKHNRVLESREFAGKNAKRDAAVELKKAIRDYENNGYQSISLPPRMRKVSD